MFGKASQIKIGKFFRTIKSRYSKSKERKQNIKRVD
jgi:hypothetical protein